MEFWDDIRNENLAYLSLGVTRDEAEELANKIRAVREVPTLNYHEIEYVDGDKKIVFYVHPEDAPYV